MTRSLSFYEGLKSIAGMKGHPVSIKFRHSMRSISSYAIHMAKYIESMCSDLQEDLEDTRDKHDVHLQFSTEDKLALERKEKKLIEEGAHEFDIFALWRDKRSQIEDELDEYEREELELLKGEIDDLEYQLNGLIEDHLQLLYQSLFIAVYSRFERYLKDLCIDVRHSESLSVKLRDLRSQGITAASDYLKKIARLSFPDTTEEWHVIKLLNKIRNSLVHDPEKIQGGCDIDQKLLDYFYLYDPFFDAFDVESTNLMFSSESIEKIVNTLVRFSEYIDEAWEKHDNLRLKFQQGPKHEK